MLTDERRAQILDELDALQGGDEVLRAVGLDDVADAYRNADVWRA